MKSKFFWDKGGNNHNTRLFCFCYSVVKSCLTLQAHEQQHTRIPCSSLSRGVCSKSCPLSQWCHPTISSFVVTLLVLPSVFPSIRVFSNESTLHIRWPKFWNLSNSNSPSSEYSGLISFQIDWFDSLVVQRILKNLLQHHHWKVSILWHSAFFMVQLSHLHMATGKNHSFNYMDFCWQSDISSF